MEREYKLNVGKPSFCDRRTTLEKVLIVLFIIALFVIIALAIYSVYPKKSVCLEPECLKASSHVLENSDLTQDPCENFYDFACGGYLKKTLIPDSRTSMDVTSELTDKIDQQVRIILGEPIEENELLPFKLVKSLFNACMDTEHINKNSLPTLRNLLRKAGGWPVLEGAYWNQNNLRWTDIIYRFRKLGLATDIFLGFDVSPDNKNASRRILTIDQPFIGLETFKRKGKNEPMVQAVLKYMIDVVTQIGANLEVAKREMEDALDFEISLTRILVPPDQRRNINAEYNPMTIRELERNYPGIPWLTYVNELVKPVTSVSPDSVIVVYLPNYIKQLEGLLMRTDKRVIVNYMFWKAIASLINYMGEDMRQIQLEFKKKIAGVVSKEPRAQECTTMATKLDVASGALYVRKFFNEGAKKSTLEMVDNIEAQFKETLQNIDWMDDDTKAHALDKLAALEKHIGYPDELMNDKKISSYYKDLSINSEFYFEAVLNLTLFEYDQKIETLLKPVNKSDWKTHAVVAEVNAYYDLNENAIQFPAGILQGLFFGPKRPNYMNYGGIGFVIGHEVTHGFDDEGKQFGKDGTLLQWWANKTEMAYNKKAECFINQYSNVLVPEVNITINGIETQGENIADNGGVKQAYLAYKKWVEKNGEELRLPGLDKYSPYQMFWISLGNAWCAKYRNEALQNTVSSSPHPPEKYRVELSLMNSGYFAKDFKCPVGSKMNPKHTCIVW